MAGIPYIKTKIGEHDYGSGSGCCGHASCRYFQEFCPLLNVKKIGEAKVVTWPTAAKARLEGKDDSTVALTRGIAATNSIYEYSGFSDSDMGQLSKEVEVGKYTCWGDGSGYEYDLMSRNMIGPSGIAEKVYDIYNYKIEHKALTYSEWNAWVDKFQYDYRYGRVSDTNAECVLFPNVDNPWMMTEYVYRGVGGDNASGKIAVPVPDEYVVEPPIYDPDTLAILNSDMKITVSSATDSGSNDTEKWEKYKPLYENEMTQGSSYDDGNGHTVSDTVANVRSYRQIEPWSALFTFTKEERTKINQTRAGNNKGALPSESDNSPVTSPVRNGGVRLYRARIPVQSVKWGEHGNIPPHALDMMAPSDWLDPTASVAKIRARYVAHVGTPLYAPRDGVITWNDRYAFIEDFTSTGTSYDSSGRKIYTYSVSGNGDAVPMPTRIDSNKNELGNDEGATALKPFEKVMGVAGKGNVCHGGCSLCTGMGNPSGVLKCGHLSSLPDSDSDAIAEGNKYFDSSKCLDADDDGHECPNFVKSKRHPLIATYQNNVISRNQVTSDFRNQAMKSMAVSTFGMAGGAVGSEMMRGAMSDEMDSLYQQYKNLGNYKEANITYELQYEVVHASPQVARLNKKKYNEFGKGVQIVPGTGKYAFDSEKDANPFSGGDTNVYGDISTLSFGRFFRSVMPCAKQAHCHEFAGIDQADGWQSGVKAGGDGKCRYYCGENGMGCPYNGVSKRAVEFCTTASTIYGVVGIFWTSYEALTGFGCWELTAGYVFKETAKRYRKLSAGGSTWLIVDETWAIKQTSDTLAVVALKIGDSAISANVDSSEKVNGAALVAASNVVPAGYMKAFEFRTAKTTRNVLNKPWYKAASSGNYKDISISVYTVKDAFYWYQPLTNSGAKVGKNKKDNDTKYIPSLVQHVDSNGYWFCKVDRGFVAPDSNCIMVDNEKKFVGGWHPEYKDYSKIGSEFMQDIVSDASREGQAMGDYVQNGDYTPIPQAVNKKGYWIDQSGEYITDERDIGWDVAIAGNDDRESNGGSAPCISFHKTNSTLDSDTGKKKQPKVDHGAVFANDPWHLLDEYSTGERPEFEDPDTNNKYVASCTVKQPLLLPTMRHALHCPKCDYYIHIRYLSSDGAMCPWCGTTMEIITGDTGAGFGSGGNDGGDGGGGGGDDEPAPFAAEGKTWKDDLPDASIMKKFFKLYAMGMADVWAPPGTSIPTDAYFWRHQATVTNATKRQIYHRLGTKGQSNLGKKNADVEGSPKVGYMFDKMTRIGELTMGYQEGIGGFMKVPKGRYVKDDSSSAEGDSSSSESWVETSADTDTQERYGKSYVKWNEGDSADVLGMYNSVMPRHMIPALYPSYDGGLEDEGVIAPYTTSSNDALKILSLDQIRVLRNAIEPMYAYVSEELRTNEYPTLRASYDLRESIDQPIIFHGRRAMIRPIVLAKTDDNRDSFQAYYSGDMVYGVVREYFPSGYTWWYMQQLLGGRVTTHPGGRFHMDDNSFAENGQLGQVIGGSGGEYTVGNKTYAKCAISIYGMLPLDKEIKAAYVIVEPSSVDPSKNPVGRSWTGGPAMYYHYHAKKVDHYKDGKEQHLHGTAGYPNDEYFDENGEHVVPHPPGWYAPLYQDESAYRMWGAQSHSIDDDRFIYYEETFSRTMVSLPGLFDTSFYKNVGTPKGAVMDEDGETEIGVGYSASSFPGNDGFTRYNIKTDRKRDKRYQYVVVDADGNLVLKFPEAEVWKTKTADEIQQVIDDNTCEVEFSVSDGTEEGTVSYTFTETDAEVYQDEVPTQSQAISGYFDMGWTNSRGYVTGKYRIDAGNGESMWNAPVIFQDATGLTNGNGGYSGGEDDNDNNGKTARVIDATTPVKGMYENRVKRDFGVDAGKSVSDLSTWTFYDQATEDVTAVDDDIKNQNKQTTRDAASGSGFTKETLLTETYAYPKMDSVTDVPEVSEEGDKYELLENAAVVVARFNLPVVIASGHTWYGAVMSGGTAGNLTAGTYSKTDDVVKLLDTVFPGCKKKKVNSRTVRIVCSSAVSLKVPAGTNSCYPALGLVENTSYPAVRDRTVECSSSLAGYEPGKLLLQEVSENSDDEGEVGSNVWRYGVFSEAPQSFVFDLLRAPLLMKERGWRYSAGDSENPSDGIKTYFYDKPFSENCLISSIDFRPPEASEYQGEAYGIYGKRSEDGTWARLFGFERRPSGKYIDDKGNEYTVGQDFKIVFSGINDYRFVKVECDSKESYVYYEFLIDHYEGVDANGNSVTGSGYQAILSGTFDDFTNISIAGVKAWIGGSESGSSYGSWDFNGNHGEAIMVVAAQVFGATNNRMRVFMDRKMETNSEEGEGEQKYLKLFVRKYYGGVDRFRVWGMPYKTEKGDDSEKQSGSGGKYLTMTDGYDVYQALIANFTRAFKLPFTPCEIAGVYLDSGSGIKLTESDAGESGIKWTTEDRYVSVLENGVYVRKTIKKITAGTYYYDAVRRIIYIPRENTAGVSWTTFESELDRYPSFKSYLPSGISIWYSDGNGKSITLPAVANGEGPSYMLEKGAINTIISSECNLTATGRRSCKILNPNATSSTDVGNSRVENIPFVCSNNLPSTLSIEDASRSNSKQGTVKFNAGEFRLPVFTGKELVGKENNDQVFIDLFGEEACNCRGKCSTEVTFTGPAQYVLHGHITVEAPANTKRTVKIGGKSVQYEEPTGGIKQGFLIVKCTPSKVGGSNRMTKCYSLPKLLIYAKERNPYTEVTTTKK